MIIYQFDDEERFPLSNRDGIYGGNGGNKEFYKTGVQVRYEKILKPALERV